MFLHARLAEKNNWHGLQKLVFLTQGLQKRTTDMACKNLCFYRQGSPKGATDRACKKMCFYKQGLQKGTTDKACKNLCFFIRFLLCFHKQGLQKKQLTMFAKACVLQADSAALGFKITIESIEWRTTCTKATANSSSKQRTRTILEARLRGRRQRR